MAEPLRDRTIFVTATGEISVLYSPGPSHDEYESLPELENPDGERIQCDWFSVCWLQKLSQTRPLEIADETRNNWQMIAGTRLTVLATPKPFHDHIGIIQRNVIGSWTHLLPRPEIYLFGDEPGTTEIAAEPHLRYLVDIARNEFGTPLLNDLFKRARELSSTQLLCYVNCDIILVQEFLEAIACVQAIFPRFLAVAHRLNIDLRAHLDLLPVVKKDSGERFCPEAFPATTPLSTSSFSSRR